MKIQYNGFCCEKNNGIWTKCENENIYTIIQMDFLHYNCYFNAELSAKYIEGLQNAIDHFNN